MKVELFNIPAKVEKQIIEQFNKFLISHRIYSIDKQFVSAGENSFWSVWVQYTDFDTPQADEKIKKSKVDYKEILDSDTFQIFSRLREIRKEIAHSQTVPVYVVFTNDELAKIASLPEITIENIRKIKGIGEKRVNNYARDLIDKYNNN